jgi:hypothetical protein
MNHNFGLTIEVACNGFVVHTGPMQHGIVSDMYVAADAEHLGELVESLGDKMLKEKQKRGKVQESQA